MINNYVHVSETDERGQHNIFGHIHKVDIFASLTRKHVIYGVGGGRVGIDIKYFLCHNLPLK